LATRNFTLLVAVDSSPDAEGIPAPEIHDCSVTKRELTDYKVLSNSFLLRGLQSLSTPPMQSAKTKINANEIDLKAVVMLFASTRPNYVFFVIFFGVFSMVQRKTERFQRSYRERDRTTHRLPSVRFVVKAMRLN